MKVDKYSVDGKVVGSVELSDSVFGAEVNDILIYELIKVGATRICGRGRTRRKSAAEVSGGGVKPWKQKGTGTRPGRLEPVPDLERRRYDFRARPRSYRIDLPRSIKRSAYRALFSLKAKQGSIKVVEDFKVDRKNQGNGRHRQGPVGGKGRHHRRQAMIPC